jgi:hypothetical protein
MKLNNRSITGILLCFGIFCLVGCKPTVESQTIHVKNPTNFLRKEIVGIDANQVINSSKENAVEHIFLNEKGSGKHEVVQWVDNDLDGVYDELLFQVSLAPNESKEYEIVWKEKGEQPAPVYSTYSRFVPERIDDYAWENDKVAFRTYGPEAQRLTEAGEPGGTLSSGIDLWLKRVSYPVIDKWYDANTKEAGYYHIDHGEGYDPYHVGISRGTGGIGVWTGDTLVTSKNFSAYRTIATGPLRTIFELDYAPWSKYGIKETKRISLDLGSNFSKFEISFVPESPVPNYTIGITLHENKGETKLNKEQGIFSQWEPIDSSYVGEGIIINPKVIEKAFEFKTETPDQSQLLILTDSTQHTLTYYTGFAWLKSGQVSNAQEWLDLLARQEDVVAHPVEISIKD